jgi:hypothetical protein
MASTINSDNGVVSSIPGLKYSADTSGVLILQTNTTDALTLDTTQGASFATGVLVNNPYAGSYSGGMVLDHTTSLGRISVAVSSAIAFYNGGISARVETMRIDSSGNVGVGAVPNTWTLGKSVSVGDVGSAVFGFGGYNSLTSGAYFNSGWKYSSSSSSQKPALFVGSDGAFNWSIAAAGTAGNAITFTQAMTLDASGNLGIGITDPSNYFSVGRNLVLGSTSTNSGLTIVSSTTTAGSLLFADGTAGDAPYRGYLQYTHSNDAMIFATSATERMRIDSSGNVGIGTTSPSATLDVGSGINRSGASPNNIYADMRITGATTGIAGSFLSRIVGIGGSTYTIPDAAVYQVAPTVAQTGVTITNAYGLYIGNMRDPSTGGSVTNGWGIYQTASDNKNYFAGDVGIGNSNPQAKLDVRSQINVTQVSPYTASIQAVKASGFGYDQNAYRAVIFGPISGNQSIALGIDPSTIAGGSFSGAGTEICAKRITSFIVPNAGSTDWQGVLSWNGTAVTIPGSLSKGSGSFRIDHPLPALKETHQLVHSFIEGPQADLIYRGVATLTAGKATINIDTAAGMTEGTFEALCREVQCFTTNESDWVAVRGKVVGNILTIEAQDATATSTISWMVIGERKDKHMLDTEWTDKNGKVIVEPLKPVEYTAVQQEAAKP